MQASSPTRHTGRAADAQERRLHAVDMGVRFHSIAVGGKGVIDPGEAEVKRVSCYCMLKCAAQCRSRRDVAWHNHKFGILFIVESDIGQIVGKTQCDKSAGIGYYGARALSWLLSSMGGSCSSIREK